MTAYVSLNDIPAGVAGDVSRPIEALIEPIKFATAEDVQPGRALKFDANGNAAYLTADADTLAGFSTRTYPAGSGYPESTKIPAGRFVGIMRKGYMLVNCVAGTPVRGGDVYMYITKTGDYEVGSFSAEADATPANTIVLEGVKWANNGVSVNNLAEIYIG